MGKGPYVFLLKWSGKEFKRTQRIFTIDRPYGLAALSIGKQEFLAIATYGRPKQPTRSLVFKWSGKKFESFQNISSVGVRIYYLLQFVI